MRAPYRVLWYDLEHVPVLRSTLAVNQVLPCPWPRRAFLVKLGKRVHPCQGVCYVLRMAGENSALFFSFQVGYF